MRSGPFVRSAVRPFFCPSVLLYVPIRSVSLPLSVHQFSFVSVPILRFIIFFSLERRVRVPPVPPIRQWSFRLSPCPVIHLMLHLIHKLCPPVSPTVRLAVQRLSVSPSVRPSVRPFVRPFVRLSSSSAVRPSRPSVRLVRPFVRPVRPSGPSVRSSVRQVIRLSDRSSSVQSSV